MTYNDGFDGVLIERIHALTEPLSPLPTALPPRTRCFPDIRAVLFDVYGTLVISASGDIEASATADQAAAYTEARLSSGLPPDPVSVPSGPDRLNNHICAAHAKLKSVGVEFPEVDILAIWRELLDTAPGTRLASDDQLRRLAIEYEFRVNPVWPMPGLSDVLATLRKRRLLLGIVSNAQFYTPLMLKAFLSAPLTEVGLPNQHCSWSFRVGQAKPSTEIYARLLARLHSMYGLRPQQILYVGNDVRKDIQPAKQLGLNTVLFAGDRRSLRLPGQGAFRSHTEPDAIITTLNQLPRELLPRA